MDVKLPDGRVITNVPEGTTQKDLMARLQGYDAQEKTGTPQLPSTGELPGTLHLDPGIAPSVNGNARPFAPGEYIDNPNGSWSSEISTTLSDPGLNGGRPTTIPTLWLIDGKPQRVSEDQAVELAKRSGLRFRPYDTMDQADAAAAQRESQWQKVGRNGAANIQPLWDKGPQPSTLDRVVASPVGRFTQENIVEPAIGLGTLVARQFSDDPRVNTILDKENAAYEGALARNRNTPGYAAERAKADRAMADNGASAGAFLPSVQSAIAGTVGLAGGLDSSNAMADAASAKQRDFAKEHPFLSLGEGLVGSLTGMPAARAALPAKVAKAVTPSVEALKAEAKKAYQVVDQSGLKVSAPAVQDLVTQIQTDVAKRGFHPMLHSKSAAVLDALGKAAGDQSIQDMEILRRVAKEGAKASDKADRAMARVVQDHIDNFMENLKPEQLSSAPDPQAQEALVTARDLWTKASRGEIIDDALEKAKNAAGANYTQAGYATAVRQRFRQIANNDRAMARFTPQQRETIKQIVRGGKTENILRLIGKLAVRGPVSGAASAGAGFAAFGPAGAFVLPAIGEAAKAGSTALTLRAARRASELARGAEVVKEPLLRAPNQLPSAAYGIPLVNSLIQDQQRNALAAYGQ